MKRIIRKFLPKKLAIKIKKILTKKLLLELYFQDYIRYSKSAFQLRKDQSVENIRARIVFHYHSLEKGLSNINLRLGFGQSALNELFIALEEYKSKRYDISDIQFQTGISTIMEYIRLHNKNNYEVSSIEERLNALITHSDSEYGGVKKYAKKIILDKRTSNFADLSQHRFSVRDFSEEPVDIKLINQALEIAMKTPSVCNRQPWNAYVIKNQELRENILKVQGGLNGFGNNVDTLIMVTSNNLYLAGIEERNQGFVDGGLFSMTLIYALGYVGLATCVLNASFDKKRDLNIRTKLGIPEQENIILFIAVGHYPDTFKVPKSKRNSFESIAKYYL